MNKIRFLIPTFIVLVSACAIFDNADTDSGKISVAPMTPTDEGANEVTVPPASKMLTPRPLSRDEIRGLQLRLKEAGFDPGPTDGVAGPRTKAAYVRLQDGCGKIKTVIEKSTEETFQATKKALTREETLLLQTQLRGAGFNPGPTDGVYGSRTRAVLLRLKTDCPRVDDFAGVLDRAAPEQPAAAVFTRAQNVSVTARDSVKRTALSQPAHSRDDVRILQLRLRDAGFDPGPFDGVMGPKTRLALEQFEAGHRGKKTKISSTTNIESGQY